MYEKVESVLDFGMCGLEDSLQKMKIDCLMLYVCGLVIGEAEVYQIDFSSELGDQRPAFIVQIGVLVELHLLRVHLHQDVPQGQVSVDQSHPVQSADYTPDFRKRILDQLLLFSFC